VLDTPVRHVNSHVYVTVTAAGFWFFFFFSFSMCMFFYILVYVSARCFVRNKWILLCRESGRKTVPHRNVPHCTTTYCSFVKKGRVLFGKGLTCSKLSVRLCTSGNPTRYIQVVRQRATDRLTIPSKVINWTIGVWCSIEFDRTFRSAGLSLSAPLSMGIDSSTGLIRS